jgi:hypothetical protein
MFYLLLAGYGLARLALLLLTVAGAVLRVLLELRARLFELAARQEPRRTPSPRLAHVPRPDEI